MSAPDATAAQLSRLVRETQAGSRLPSVSAAIFRGDQVVWQEAVGLADAASGEDATPDHQYRIGSITKTFTACALMQLRDAGELQLDDRLDAHVPESPHGPTIRRMLSHLSGLQRELPGEIWESMESPTREEILRQLDETEQVLSPGQLWHYSNLAYSLLGEVIARRSGAPYQQYVQERLLDPLGLARTTWGPAPPVAKGYFVDPYADDVHLERYDVDLRGGAAAGALWSTTADLCRWGAFLADPDATVLSPETVEEMRSVQVMADRETWKLAWGLGLMLHRRDDRIYVGHDGGMPGHVTRLVCAPKEKIGAVVLTASTAPGAKAMELAVELAAKALEASPAARDPWRPEGGPPEEIAPVLGRWWSEGGEWVFSYRNGRLEARYATAPGELEPAVFEPAGDGRYRTESGPEAGEWLRVVRDDQGAVVKLYWATYPFTREPKTFGVAS